MFTKSVIATTLIALAASAAAWTTTPNCSTGPVQCCDSTTSTITPSLATLLGSLGIDVSSVSVPIGLTCTSILSSGSCNSEPVCCENNSFNGVVALGCSPVTINL